MKTKICKSCKKVFEKKINCSLKSWEKTEFCSRSCINRNRKPWNKNSVGKMPKPWNKGIKIQLNTGKTHFKKGERPSVKTEFKKGQKPWNYGIPNPNFQGKNNPNWKGGITPENHKIRTSREYKEWRTKIFERDNYVCQECGIKGGWHKELNKKITLNADHIKPFALFPKLRFEVSNGRTMCIKCHRKTKTYGINLDYYNSATT